MSLVREIERTLSVDEAPPEGFVWFGGVKKSASRSESKVCLKSGAQTSCQRTSQSKSSQ